MRRVLLLTLCAIGTAIAQEKKTEEVKLSDQEKTLIVLLNEARKKEKLPAVRVRLQLCKVARLHSENMARQEKMSHTLDGKGVADRVTAGGYDWRVVRENLAQATADEDPRAPPPAPQEIHDKWMESKGHRANMLNARVTEAGLSVVLSKKGTYFYTLVLATPGDG